MGPAEWKSQHKDCFPNLCCRHGDPVWLGLLQSVNFSQNFPSEGREDEDWLPHWLMADVSLGSTNKAPLRVMLIQKPRVWERPKAESRIILYLLEVGPCQQELNLSSQQMKQRWTKEMRISFQDICCIKQTYVKASYGTVFASI